MSTLTRWKYKAGVELTFQREVKNSREFREWQKLEHINTGYFFRCHSFRIADLNNLNRLVSPKLTCGNNGAHIDPDCIEVSTKILESWNSAEKTIKTVLEKAKKINLIAKNKGISTGGGGHVHISGMTPLVMCAMVREMQNRSYVPWFFADPDTTNQCNCASVKYCLNRVLLHDWNTVAENPGSYSTDKYCHTRLHWRGTVEFRFFDCFDSWEQYEESLAFAQAYARWIEKRVERGESFDVKICGRKDALEHFNDYDKCIREFKKLIKNIELPWNRYEKYVANLEERFTDERLLR